jgi:hypothetical protein
MRRIEADFVRLVPRSARPGVNNLPNAAYNARIGRFGHSEGLASVVTCV